MKDTLDNTKKEFTEAQMWEFAIDLLANFPICKMYITKSEIGDFLTENIEKFKNK